MSSFYIKFYLFILCVLTFVKYFFGVFDCWLFFLFFCYSDEYFFWFILHMLICVWFQYPIVWVFVDINHLLSLLFCLSDILTFDRVTDRGKYSGYSEVLRSFQTYESIYRKETKKFRQLFCWREIWDVKVDINDI